MKKLGVIFLALSIELFFIGGGFAQTHTEIITSDKEKVKSLSEEIPAGKPFIIQVNGKGEKTVYFLHSGQNEPELQFIRSDQYKADTLASHPEGARRLRTGERYDYEIVKTENTDFQQGTVNESLKELLELTVTDLESNPAAGVEIVFEIRAGGGSFAGGQSTVNVLTDPNGRASAALTLGQDTSDNPYGWQELGKNLQQVGLNIVDAYPAEEPSNKAVFYAYGFPDEPSLIHYYTGDLDGDPEKFVLTHVFELGLWVTDEHGNFTVKI